MAGKLERNGELWRMGELNLYGRVIVNWRFVKQIVEI
jgi:hypothetical protein